MMMPQGCVCVCEDASWVCVCVCVCEDASWVCVCVCVRGGLRGVCAHMCVVVAHSDSFSKPGATSVVDIWFVSLVTLSVLCGNFFEFFP